MNETKEKVILVTGGAQGLGKAICNELACKEYTILIADRQQEKAEETLSHIKDKGYKGEVYKLDLCDEKSIEETFEKIKKDYGRLDVLINNAGVDITKTIMEMSIEEWDRVINVNLRGPFIMTKCALSMMTEKNQGNIINIISTAALRGWTEASAYHASKWGLRGFTQALFTEGRRNNVKVTAIIAGGMKTPFLLDRFPDLDQTKLQDPKNVAQTIKFILSQPEETAIPEMMVIPLQETSWP